MNKNLSLRSKIFFLYIILLVVTLSVFSISIYIAFRDSLYQKLDSLLTVKARGIQDAIEAYWLERETGNNVAERFDDFLRKKIQFKKVTEHLTQQDDREPQELSDVEISIFDSKGVLLDSSRTLPQLGSIRPNLINFYYPQAASNFGNLSMQTQGGQLMAFRTLTIPVTEGRHEYQVKFIVQVVASLDSLNQELNHFKRIFWLRIPLVILIAGVAAFQVVKLSLSPLKEMTKKMTQLSPNNMQVRIDMSQTEAEFIPLAERFNEMVDNLEKSFGAQRRIIQDISHELKTPLTIIMGELEVALRKARDPEEYHSILTSCFEESKKIKRIIDDVLILAKLDATALMKEDMKPIDLHHLLKDVLEDIKVMAKSKNIQLIFLARAETRMSANETLLKQLFSNLLENAVKFTPAEGKIKIQLDEDDRFVTVQIIDSGVGIPEDELPYIFDRFYRVDKARHAGDGIGVGLSIAKSIVEAHQGSIRVESKLGTGTTFKIFFPRSAVMKLLA